MRLRKPGGDSNFFTATMLLAASTHSRFSAPASVQPGGRIARWVLCWMVCCLVFQGMVLTDQRTHGRAHRHGDSSRLTELRPTTADRAQHIGDLDGHRYAPQIAFADPQRPDHPAQDHDDGHSSVAHHDHEPDLDDLVYVAEDDGASTLNPYPALARSIHDLDVLAPKFDLAVDADATPRWRVGKPPLFDSHVSDPLERPPRA